jgi:hypothetical protein
VPVGLCPLGAGEAFSLGNASDVVDRVDSSSTWNGSWIEITDCPARMEDGPK